MGVFYYMSFLGCLIPLFNSWGIYDLYYRMPFLYGCITLFTVFSPVLVAGSYLLYKFFSFLYKKFIPSEKTLKKDLSTKAEKRKTLFYNVFLPSVISTSISILGIVIFWSKKIDSEWSLIVILALFGMIFVGSELCFCIFYLLYHLIYFIITRIISCKYYGGKSSLIIFMISVMLFFVSYALIIPYLPTR